MFCTAIVAGTVVTNYLFGKVLMKNVMRTEKEKTLKLLFGISGTLLLVSGFANIFLVKGKTDMKKYPLWKQLIYFKFLVGIIISPIFEKTIIPMLGIEDYYFNNVEVPLKFWSVVLVYPISTWTKMIREKAAA